MVVIYFVVHLTSYTYDGEPLPGPSMSVANSNSLSGEIYKRFSMIP